MTEAFPTLIRTGDGLYSITIDPQLAVGPPGHAYLFGGACLGLALDVAADAVGRPVVQGALQFVSFTPLGQVLDMAVEILQAGKTVAQVRVTGSVADRQVFQAGVTLGERPGFADRQWATAPQVPPPELCPPCATLPPQDAQALLLEGMEVREADTDALGPGRSRLWLKRLDGSPIDTVSLAMFADFIPIALGRVSGRAGGGNSLDNSLRMVRTAPPGWCLCDMIIPATASGFAQGQVSLWDEGGSLLATGAQSLLIAG